MTPAARRAMIRVSAILQELSNEELNQIVKLADEDREFEKAARWILVGAVVAIFLLWIGGAFTPP